MPQYHNQSLKCSFISTYNKVPEKNKSTYEEEITHTQKEYLQDLWAINIHIESVHYIGSPKKDKKPITSQTTTPLSFQGIKDKENSLRLLRTERKEAPKSKNMLETRSH